MLTNISSFYDDIKDIKLTVHETLSDFLGRYKFDGWVRGNDVPDVAPLLDEIKRLSLRNTELENALSQLQEKIEKSPKNKSKDEEFSELISILRNIEISTDLINDDGTMGKYSLLDLFVSVSTSIVAGITNQYPMTDINRFIYFNICPKLQVHGLVKNEKVAGVQWRRFSIAPKGEQFLAYIDRLLTKKDNPATA